MKRLAVLLVVLGLLVFGCTQEKSETPPAHAPPVANPTEETGNRTNESAPSEEIPCTCPECNDTNPCMLSRCDQTTNCSCVYSPLEGDVEGCEGEGENCTGHTCVSGICETVDKSDRECDGNAYCDDNISCTADTCTIIGNCTTRCSHSDITFCQSGDDCCPKGCNAINDTDCPLFMQGSQGDFGGLKISVNEMRLVHCYTDYDYIKDTDYGYDLRITLEITNNRAERALLSASDFTLLDRYLKKRDYDSYPIGGDCSDGHPISYFTPLAVSPGETVRKELWYEMGRNQKLVSGEAYLIFDEDGQDAVFKGYVRPIN